MTLALGGTQVELVDPASPARGRLIDLPRLSMAEANPAMASQPNSNQKVQIVVTSLAFSPDGKTLAAGLLDTSVRLLKAPF
jgi:hypothetical protein